MNSIIKTRLWPQFITLSRNRTYLRLLSSIKKPIDQQINYSQQSIYLVDENKINEESKALCLVNKYTTRTATCGELNKDNLGQRVILTGWMEFSRMNKFLVLRDAYGQTQLLIRDDANEIRNKIKDLSYESVLKVHGTVLARPREMINKRQLTGEIEVSVEDLEVVNEAAELPFNIREYQKANESLQMQYRYLAMRFPEMQRNLRFRSDFCMHLREFLAKKSGFVEVETPTLFKATPGGAQEFVVPTRHKNKFYSLVQSPQQFKQMLMCGGIDRYFQIARCYRDETSRPDRQPEFTQLDIEMANTSVDGVLELIEDLLQFAWPDNLPPIPKKFQRMQYRQAIEMYGCDKPDISYNNTIIDTTNILTDSLNVHGQGDDFYAGCLVFEDDKHNIKPLSKNKNIVPKDYPNTTMIHVKISSFDEFKESMKKLIANDCVIEELFASLEIKGPASIVLVYGNHKNALKRLGKIRDVCAAELHKQGVKIYKPGMHFLWIVDFPLFSKNDDGMLISEHHPFTSPHLDDLHLLDVDPLKIRALSYDLVLNGYEVGGGSIRIHNAQLQQKILNMLNISGLDHIVEMLSYGCPPHGGVALGLDRIFAKLLNTPSIRDVIAFPKTFDGKDPLSGAPSVIPEACRKIYHL